MDGERVSDRIVATNHHKSNKHFYKFIITMYIYNYKSTLFILNVPPDIFALIDYRSDNKLIKFYIIANKIKIMYTTSRKCTIDVKFTV